MLLTDDPLSGQAWVDRAIIGGKVVYNRLQDPRLAEVPVAYVVRDPDSDVTEEALIERCRGRIASFKIPRHVIFIDAMPATPSGKIRKVELREWALEQLGDPHHG